MGMFDYLEVSNDLLPEEYREQFKNASFQTKDSFQYIGTIYLYKESIVYKQRKSTFVSNDYTGEIIFYDPKCNNEIEFMATYEKGELQSIVAQPWAIFNLLNRKNENSD